MPRKFVAASSQYCEYTTGIVTVVPISLSCWFNPPDATTVGTLMSEADSSGNNYFTLVLSGSTAGRVYIEVGGGGTSHTETTTSYLAGVWQHALAVFSSGTNGAVYLNGGGKATFTLAAVQSGINKVDIGVLNTAGLFSKLSGMVAQAAIWNVALGDMDAARLAAGVHPKKVRGGNLLGLWELNGTNTFLELDSMHGQHMSLVAKPIWVPPNLGPPKVQPYSVPVPMMRWALTGPTEGGLNPTITADYGQEPAMQMWQWEELC